MRFTLPLSAACPKAPHLVSQTKMPSTLHCSSIRIFNESSLNLHFTLDCGPSGIKDLGHIVIGSTCDTGRLPGYVYCTLFAQADKIRKTIGVYSYDESADGLELRVTNMT